MKTKSKNQFLKFLLGIALAVMFISFPLVAPFQADAQSSSDQSIPTNRIIIKYK
jgi:hypothetical protein